jgi:hypothetical protein
VKAGDAKLWVYRHTNDQDRQATEDDKVQFFGIFRLAYYKSGIFFTDGSNLQEHRSTSADPMRVGSATTKRIKPCFAISKFY